MIEGTRFTFTSGNGASLAARIDRPASGPVRATALFAHCFTCTKDSLAAQRIAAALAALGILTVRFDFTGLGGSGGEFANSGFACNVADLIAAADHMRENIGAPTILIGHSLGGAAVIAAAAAVPEAKAVITLGAPFDVGHVLGQLQGDLAAVERDGAGEVQIAGRPFRISSQFLAQMREHDQGERLAHLKRALLVLHAPADQTVGIDNARLIFRAAKHPKSFIGLPPAADHLLTRKSDAAYVARMIAAWVEPYLPDEDPAEEAAGAHGEVVVETLGGKFAQAVRAGSHHWIGDEPVSLGGEDRGPAPYDLLLAALGTCSSMTVKMYADRKGIPLERVRVVLNHSRDYASDCVDCDDPAAKIDIIDREIGFTGDLTAEQRTAMLAIADRCPVHKTLTSKVEIRTREAE